MEISEQDAQIIEKLKNVIPKLSPSSKEKLLTVVETMVLFHELKADTTSKTAIC
ncbi:MAG: hypothetical protein J6Z82_07095 [Schwartzia sp.]|nr:hypothetical protein [Schwartzia sp. (in: firmicutes)]